MVGGPFLLVVLMDEPRSGLKLPRTDRPAFGVLCGSGERLGDAPSADVNPSEDLSGQLLARDGPEMVGGRGLLPS